jgi:hypothetical protein
MADQRPPKFSLYHTLKKPSKTGLSSQRKENLIVKLKEAIVGLVCEHAYFVDGWTTSLNPIVFPYGSKNTEDGFELHLDSLPDQLLLILKEFLRISKTSSE